MAPPGRIVIVGAGHAGGTAAAQLRQYGFAGEIVLVGAEPLLPYQRPPLSKAWLKGEVGAEALELRPDAFYEEARIDVRLSTSATSVDRSARAVSLSDGGSLTYDRLILATGSLNRPLPVPGADHPAVLELRSAADADRLKTALERGGKLVVVGAGYIGLEAAATARGKGCEVTVVERESRVLARTASPVLSAFFESAHRARGVELLTGVAVSAIENEGRAVRLADGRIIEGDTVLVGIGAVAADGLAVSMGLECRGGIVVDAEARTSDPEIFAIGDCTLRPLPGHEGRLRLESVPNALEQARHAAAAIAGHAPPSPEVPWFWSDQYEFKLQIAGLGAPGAELVVRGDPASGAFGVFHLSNGRVLAVEAVNAPPEFMAGKKLIGEGRTVDSAALADTGVPMKSFLKP